MAKKNFTWKLDEDLVSKIQQLAEKKSFSRLSDFKQVIRLKALQGESLACNN